MDLKDSALRRVNDFLLLRPGDTGGGVALLPPLPLVLAMQLVELETIGAVRNPGLDSEGNRTMTVVYPCARKSSPSAAAGRFSSTSSVLGEYDA